MSNDWIENYENYKTHQFYLRPRIYNDGLVNSDRICKVCGFVFFYYTELIPRCADHLMVQILK